MRSQRETPGAVSFEPVGTLAGLIAADSDSPGILQVRCRGLQRFQVLSSHQRPDGLWLAHTEPLPGDDTVALHPTMSEELVLMK